MNNQAFNCHLLKILTSGHLTNSMEQSPCEANGRSVSEEIPHHSGLWKAKVQYRIHKSPPSVPILNHMNPFHTLTPHFLTNDFHIILQSNCRPRCSKEEILFQV
jgi:hypothetical protein